MDTVGKKKRSELMSKIRSKNTQPEIIVRKFLRNKGHKYKLHDRKLPGSPDIVIKKYNLAIQVRGCFWHGHNCSIGHYPKSNKKFWKNKILTNKNRDKKNDWKLRKLGFRLIVIPECKIYSSNFKKKLQF